jgi:signal transduction histidine kinase
LAEWGLALVLAGVAVALGLAMLASRLRRPGRRDMEEALQREKKLRTELERTTSSLKQLQRHVQFMDSEHSELRKLLLILPDVAAKFSANLSVRGLARVVAETWARLLDAARVTVYLREDTQLFARASFGGDALLEEVEVGEGRLGWAAKKGIVMTRGDFASESSIVKRKLGRDSVEQRWDICAPLIFRGELMGAVGVSGIRRPLKDEKRLASMIAHLSGIALKNAELYSRLDSFSKELESKVQERTGELRRAYEELKELDRLKDEFLSSVSHELRTPLTSIRSFSELLLTFGDDDRENRDEFLTIIHDESKRLTRLINDVLDIAKIESGRMEWRPEKISVVDVLENTVDLSRALLREKKMHARVEYDEPFQPALADRDRITQVVTNLLSNAIKFSPDRGEIILRSHIEGEAVVVEVQDFGKGIPPDELEHIFDRFRQIVDKKAGKPSGTGLGLTICRQIVEHHGGRIWAASEVGKGSTFYFTLPVYTGREAPESPDTTEEGLEDFA